MKKTGEFGNIYFYCLENKTIPDCCSWHLLLPKPSYFYFILPLHKKPFSSGIVLIYLDYFLLSPLYLTFVQVSELTDLLPLQLFCLLFIPGWYREQLHTHTHTLSSIFICIKLTAGFMSGV